jgi:hypothetical protein
MVPRIVVIDDCRLTLSIGPGLLLLRGDRKVRLLKEPKNSRDIRLSLCPQIPGGA